MTNTNTTNEKKTTAKQAFFEATGLAVVCTASAILSAFWIDSVAPLIGVYLVMGFCCFTVFKRYFEIKKSEAAA